nr:hypothetical protein BaRGS_023531 [Batillaria attramentaria]
MSRNINKTIKNTINNNTITTTATTTTTTTNNNNNNSNNNNATVVLCPTMTSAHYNLPAAGRDRPGVGVDAYRSPFSPSGQATYVWSDRAQPLPQILKENSLPLVVKLSEEANVRSEGDNSMDFRQPLLLYREHQVSRLYARNVTETHSAGITKVKEVGPYIVIPHNYQGLFLPLGQQTKPLPSVSTVARLMPVSILSLVSCEGYVCVSPIESDTVYQKTDLPPGVYIVKDVIEDDVKVHNGRNHKTKLVRCLRCVNDSNKVVLFPLKASGEFYVAGVDPRTPRHSSVDPAIRVYRWPELTKHGQQDTQTWSEFDRYVAEIKVRRDYEVDSVELRESGM